MRSLAVLLLAGLTSCGTMFNSSTEGVSFSSDPEGARVYVNGQPMGTTPCQVALPNTKSFTAEFRKDGYESRTTVVNASLGAGYLVLDIVPGFFFGIIPIVVDAATGNWKQLDTTHVSIVLDEAREARQ